MSSIATSRTTAVFSVVDGVLLRPLPYPPDGDRIVRVGWSYGEGGGTVGAVSPSKFRHVADNARTLRDLATLKPVSFELGEGPRAPIVEGQRVSRIGPPQTCTEFAKDAREAHSGHGVAPISHRRSQWR